MASKYINEQMSDEFIKQMADELKINEKVIKKLFKAFVYYTLMKHANKVEQTDRGIKDFEFFIPYLGTIYSQWEKDLRSVKNKTMIALSKNRVQLFEGIKAAISDLHDGYVDNLIESVLQDELLDLKEIPISS